MVKYLLKMDRKSKTYSEFKKYKLGYLTKNQYMKV